LPGIHQAAEREQQDHPGSGNAELEDVMHHKATIKSGRAANLPIFGQCSCGTGGDFGSAYEAAQYFARHFMGLGGICTSELVDETAPPPEPVPAAVAEVKAEEHKETVGDA
jgi:hypothetical protein